MRPTQGATFGGRYELDSRVAIGGMGEVWEATDHVIGRTVAIKILKDEYMGDPGFLERFRAEARHAALVNHEGIASVFDYGEENGSAFLVMELVPGEALSTILEREGSLSTDKTLDIVAQTASALQAAHAAGLVHRDIKPGNLLITPDGRVKITDFGIARIADQVPLTATGQVMGTVQYLSPEQASGHSASPATDTYSLGIVAYESLAGKRPFTGESQVAIAMAQINEQPPPLPPTVAEPVQNLVMAMIAKKPEERPASSAAVARAASALRRGDVAAAAAAVPAVASGLNGDDATQLLGVGNTSAATQMLPAGTSINSTTTDEPEKRKRSPWTWPLIALIALLVIVLVGTVWALFGNQSAEPAPTTSQSTPAATPSRSATPSPSATTVDVSTLGLVGRTCDEARGIAEAAGLTSVTCNVGTPASSSEQVGTVYDVEPSGNVPKGDPVTLSVYGEQTAVGAPTVPRIQENGTTVQTVRPGSTVQINWDGFSCPSGTGSVVSYNFTAVNGIFTSTGQSTAQAGPNQRPIELEVGSNTSQALIVSYTVTCSGSGNGTTRDSDASPQAQATVQAAASPSPSATTGTGNGITAPVAP
ncbi:protein kinase [Microbacterium sp. cx-55]|uniref:protein kinase domain-containing protein n=1 Tax=Microbacterium sp. cx-55 TaxID=2875948 RepID=UPI001CBBBFC8|nr:protein kinase [Microbacterium sp. cx-55]MBZ4487208.1 protein kinase [Microbacterium sp. cx-55]UGB35232.1 protein kinase [Microbacterium sp. cx-55]